MSIESDRIDKLEVILHETVIQLNKLAESVQLVIIAMKIINKQVKELKPDTSSKPTILH